ncbi:hypothetical protein N7462_006302 [Penicillium macrosclerotiorum]|uniref:uncharacterized protein n=1 Tax=Penicillium macrosclerotiorum TaxID=303699 RepID=UPI002548AD97|nr:uncharacterized protein N7462_006302 [Penicillium macrosclerotiorum]KAJ5683137.1 hypothetical protein N7462_006302 [Penicillium macrosclerotiorum]
MAASSTKILTGSCHCRKVQFTLNVPTEALPLKIHLCHCTICRYSYGTLCCFHAPLPAGVQPQFIAPSSLDQMTSYTHPSFRSLKWSCSHCGCHIGDQGIEDGGWTISSAIFDVNRDDPEIWKFNSHMCPSSTPDGGLSAVFSTVDGHRLEMNDLGEPAPSTTAPAVSSLPRRDENDKLLAQCHCGGVSFTISRPRDDFLASPHSKGWVSSIDPKRWLACLDLCDDCRLVSGGNVLAWMFVPKDHISPPMPPDLMIGSSKGYQSTDDVLRTFCGTCGATVFYYCEARPGIVDVAVGLLRAPEGAMAEQWAVWRAGRPSWPENGLRYHAGFSRALIEGMKKWGAERGHAQDFVIP